MGSFFDWLIAVATELGGIGILLVSIGDSSFLILPIANDLLVVLLTSRNHELFLYYAAMATIGSTAGFLILDLIFREGGHATIEKHVPAKRLAVIKNKLSKRTAWVLAIAAIIPPPFPLKPFVAGAAALQYPRKKLLSVVTAARFVRFTIDAVIALFFAEQIIRFLDSPILRFFVYALLFIGIAASAASVYFWIKRSRAERRQEEPGGMAS